ncbi:MAG: PspA/IM30 family protein [Verrucomicrobia bacterium]|nr:PspA/IM30 family protein [Verrucomicrobiota bacterium]MCH8526354.1 PspA/IM30 family protein [Kiritimatiellia bacterium]
MAILERIRRIAKGNITQWLNQVETPEAEVLAKITELENASTEAKNALAGFAVTYKRLEKNLDSLRASRDDLAARAEASLTAGDETTARRALAEKVKTEERIQNLEPVLTSRRETYDELKENLVEIQDQLNQARSYMMDLRARKRAADAEKSMGRQLDNLRSPGELGFERLEDAVLELESQVEIDREMRGEFRPHDSTAERRDLKVDAEMAALKAKLSGGGAKSE